MLTLSNWNWKANKCVPESFFSWKFMYFSWVIHPLILTSLSFPLRSNLTAWWFHHLFLLWIPWTEWGVTVLPDRVLGYCPNLIRDAFLVPHVVICLLLNIAFGFIVLAVYFSVSKMLRMEANFIFSPKRIEPFFSLLLFINYCLINLYLLHCYCYHLLSIYHIQYYICTIILYYIILLTITFTTWT